MKLESTYILSLLFLFIFSSNKITAQSISPNTIIIQPYYGAPNLKHWAYNTDFDSNNSYSAKSFGHVGLSGEVTVSKRIGLGFDAIYSPFSRTENSSYTYYNETTNSTEYGYQERTFKEDKLRLIAKIYIHFNIENPQWDLYLSGGVGANIIFAKAYIDGKEVNYGENFSTDRDLLILRTPFPFSGRFCFGARYFFNENFGINFETGVGGPPFSFGLNVRF